MGKKDQALVNAQRNKTPLFVGHCAHRDCPFCAQDFFKWYAARMNQMATPQKGMATSFADAAATSVKPPRLDVPSNVEPGTRVRIAKGVQSVMDWARTGVVVSNSGFVALDGVHRVYVKFTGYGGGTWEWAMNLKDLELVLEPPGTSA